MKLGIFVRLPYRGSGQWEGEMKYSCRRGEEMNVWFNTHAEELSRQMLGLTRF